MIPEKMSREELIEFVSNSLVQCRHNYSPFVAGEFYQVTQDGYYTRILSNQGASYTFTYAEFTTYFIAEKWQEN